MKAPTTMSFFRTALGTIVGTAGAAAVAVTGCTPSTFVDLSDQAPVEALNRPDAFNRTGFGATLAAEEGQLGNGEPSTRLAVGGGTDTGTWLFDIWNSDAVGTFRISSSACGDPCRRLRHRHRHVHRRHPALRGRRHVHRHRRSRRQPGAREVRDHAHHGVQLQHGPRPRVRDVGRGGPRGVHRPHRGAVVVGAPGAADERGSVFWVPLAGGMPQELTEVADTAGVVGAEARLGQFLTTASLPDAATLASDFPTVPGLVVLTPYLAAIAAPGQDRVVFAAIGVDSLAPTDIDAVVLACIDGAAGFGRALAAGDVNGDGMPEVYIGFGESSEDHPGIVHVFDLADLATLGAGCADTTNADDPGLSVIDCPTLDGADCTDAAFGSSLALGDVDADGSLDLMVGAPRMTVEGKPAAGGVFVVAGSSSGIDATRASFLQLSNPSSDDRLGASLAALRTHYGIPGVAVRHEVAAGAPGANAAYVFLCSGLGDDVSTTGDRCLEQATEE